MCGMVLLLLNAEVRTTQMRVRVVFANRVEAFGSFGRSFGMLCVQNRVVVYIIIVIIINIMQKRAKKQQKFF